MIPIPTGMSYTSTVSGSAVKAVECEKCTKVYLYFVVRTGTGTGNSPLFLDNEGAAGRAQQSAQQELMQKLERAVDVIPCPQCGWYQAAMVVKAKREYRGWMLNVGACLLVALVPVSTVGAFINEGRFGRGPYIPWLLYWGVASALALLGLGLIIRRWIDASQYDPNTLDPQASIELGRQRAVLLEEIQSQADNQDPPPANS